MMDPNLLEMDNELVEVWQHIDLGVETKVGNDEGRAAVDYEEEEI